MSKESSNLGQYGKDIREFKLLTPEKESILCNEMLSGNIKSRNELITSNLRLVIKVAMKYKNLGVDVEELICEGNKGLIIATNKFDPKQNTKFSTYAYFWIKQSILSSINEHNKFASRSNNNVMNYSSEFIDKDLSVNMNEFEYCDCEKIKSIIKRIDGLPKRDSMIVKHYFGVSGFSEMNTIELSEKYNVTTMRISSIIENSIRKIRCQELENFEK